MLDLSQEGFAIFVGAVVLFAAVILLYVVKRMLGSVDGTAYIAILLVPLIAYTLASGQLAEFSGPGGWGAKFRAAATSSVETSEIIENAEALQAVEKGGLRELQAAVERLNPDLPNALTLRVGRSGYYAPDVIRQYLTTLMTVGPSTYVVFVADGTGQFIGSANASQVLAVFGSETTTNDFMYELEYGGETAFGEFNFLIKQSLSPDDPNAVALEKFLDTNAEALVVVSQDGRQPLGIVDRSRLMTKLMVKLAADE